MTVKELKYILENYPQDMEIKINIGRKIAKAEEVTEVLDLDTNITYCTICTWEDNK